MNHKTQQNSFVRLSVVFTFLLMIAANALAAILPINDRTTGDVSNSYQNLFAPAALTFSIWGVIYILLACSTLFQLGFFRGKETVLDNKSLDRIGIFFSISSLANAAWIFSWHYDQILLSLIWMLVILVCLIKINLIIKKMVLTKKEKFFIQIPFRVYFGWITVATIANVTTFLVSIHWNGWNLSESIWTILVLVAGLVIGGSTLLKFRDLTYGLVLLWAYFGIWVKHTSTSGFNSQYPEIIVAVIVCWILFLIGEIFIALRNRDESAKK